METGKQRRTIVDAVCVVIFVVPTKCGEHHPDVGPRHGHSRNVGFDEPKKRFGQNWNIVQIPWILRIWIQWMRFQCGHSTRITSERTNGAGKSQELTFHASWSERRRHIRLLQSRSVIRLASRILVPRRFLTPRHHRSD